MKSIKKESPFPKVQLPRVPRTLKWGLFFKLCSRIANAHISSFFNPLQMNKLATGFASVLILSIAGWGVFQFGITTTYQDHVSNAQVALTELDTFVQTGTVAFAEPVFQIIPTAHAEGDAVENRYVQDLVSTVVHETELAIEKVEDSRDPVDVEEALDIIDELQEDTIDVLVDVVDIIEDEDVLDDIIDAIETTEEDNAEVEEAIEEVAEAIENGDGEVIIDITTEIDETEEILPVDDDDEDEDESNKEEKEQKRLREAKALYNEVKASLEGQEGEMSQKMQGKLERIEAALEGCGEDASATGCKSGKIKGLSTALRAQIKNEVRKEEKVQEKKQKGKDEEDDEDVEEGEDDETIIDDEDGDTEDVDENGNGNQEKKEEKVSNKGEDKNLGKDKENENKGKGKTEDVEEDEEVVPAPAPIPSPVPGQEPAIDELVRETAPTADTSAEEEKGNSGQGNGKNK